MPRKKLSDTSPDTIDTGSMSSVSESRNPSNNTILTANEIGEVAVSLPGLADFSIDRVDQFVPGTNREANQITDLLRPQIADKLTESDRDTALNEYELGINAEKVKQKGFDYIGEQFKSEINRNKAVGEFVKVGTSIENVKGAVIDYFTATEQNREKGARYVSSQVKANTAIAILPETIATADQFLNQARLNREMAELKTSQMFTKLANQRIDSGELLTPQ